jgi:hypothetical protein
MRLRDLRQELMIGSHVEMRVLRREPLESSQTLGTARAVV